MKILAIGDFHGTFQKKFEKIIKKEKIDLIVSNGDYSPFSYRKLWFKHCYGINKELWEVIGKKKHKALVMKDLKKTEMALKALDRLQVPVFTVLGNTDYPPDDVSDSYNKRKSKIPKWDTKEPFLAVLKKYRNIKRFDYSFLKFGNYVFIGMRGHSFPGRVKSKAFRKHKKILEELFRKFRKENEQGRVIFVSHNIAYNTKLDEISTIALKFAEKSYQRNDKRRKLGRGKHWGSKMARRIVYQYHPFLHIGGHIHEGMGKQKLGRSWLVNPGSAHEGKGAVIEIDGGKIKEIKFIN